MNGEIGSSIMCRACMKVDGVLLPMYGGNAFNDKHFSDKLADLASIQIDKDDGLPSVLCTKCAYRTESFHEFKLQVQATEKKLRKMFQQPYDDCVSPKSAIFHENSNTDDKYSPDDNAEIANYSSNNETKIDKDLDEIVQSSDVSNNDDSSNPTIRILELADEDSTNEMTILESLDFIDNPDKNESNDIFNSNDETSIVSKCNNVDSANLPIVKRETTKSMKNILLSRDNNYTLLYVSEDNELYLSSPRNVCDLIDTKESITSDETMEIISTDKSQDCNILKNNKEPVIEVIASKNVDSMMKNTNSKNDITEICQTAELKSSNDDDSESDFFDSEKNLMGTLNDTITRIKEIKINDEKIIFQCTLCMENYDELTGILAHTVETHVPRDGPFFCVVCEKDCPNHRDLREHVKCHSGKYPYTCFVCNKSYSMKRYLKRHMSCHTDLPRHRCPKCGKRYSLKTELEQHLSTHIYDGPPFSCSQCPRLFNHKGNYKRHLISHLDPSGVHLPKFPCQQCGKRFLNNRTLQTHLRVHTGEKPFQCDICGRSFSQRGNLLNHRKIHLNPRSHTCEICGKSFNQRSTLRDHGLLHTGEKPYVCNVCGFAFTFSAALRRHMWSHADDKPFGCEICNARFVGKYDIKRHMKIHSDRPKIRRKRRTKEDSVDAATDVNEMRNVIENNECDFEGVTDTKIFIEEVLFVDDTEDIGQDEVANERKNVDELFTLVELG